MSEDKVWTEFNAFWNAPEQEELRMSCAKGWAFEVWQASRTALVVEPELCQECGGDGAGGEHEEDCVMIQGRDNQ